MADKISDKSMLDLAVKKSPVSRRDAEGLDADGKKTDNGKQFNGFLQTFLGKDGKNQTKTGQFKAGKTGNTANRFNNDIITNPANKKIGRAHV